MKLLSSFREALLASPACLSSTGYASLHAHDCTYSQHSLNLASRIQTHALCTTRTPPLSEIQKHSTRLHSWNTGRPFHTSVHSPPILAPYLAHVPEYQRPRHAQRASPLYITPTNVFRTPLVEGQGWFPPSRFNSRHRSPVYMSCVAFCTEGARFRLRSAPAHPASSPSFSSAYMRRAHSSGRASSCSRLSFHCAHAKTTMTGTSLPRHLKPRLSPSNIELYAHRHRAPRVAPHDFRTPNTRRIY